MRKTTVFIGLTLASLVIMACGFVGAVQQNIDVNPIDSKDVGEDSIAADDVDVEEIETESQIEIAPVPVDPVQSAKNCLANTWEINGLNDYVVAAVPPELAKEYNLQYEDTRGQAYFTLTPEGQIILDAENLILLFSAKISIFEVPVTVLIDGTAIGNYDVDSTTLTTFDMDTSRLTASAQALNEDLIEPDQIINSIPFINPPFNTAKYSCEGDTFELKLSGYSGNIPPLVFQVVE